MPPPMKIRPRKAQEKPSTLWLILSVGTVCFLAVTVSLWSLPHHIKSTSADATTTTIDPHPLMRRQERSSSRRQLPSTNEHEEMLQCLNDTLSHLPVGMGWQDKKNPSRLPVIWAHHLEAHNIKGWNADLRFQPMDLLLQHNNDECRVWEVGANKYAFDTQELIQHYPHCQYHAFEPIAKFFRTLNKFWSNDTRVTPHKYGIGPEKKALLLPRGLMESEATYIGDNIDQQPSYNKGSKKDKMHVYIRSYEDTIEECNGAPSLLHINCEGCEWDFLRNAPFF